MEEYNICVYVCKLDTKPVSVKTLFNNKSNWKGWNLIFAECEYDDLLVVGTDVGAAIDALWRRAETKERSLASILVEIFPSLAPLTPQNTVHAKTLYSAVNMIRRMPPGPILAELVSNPAFQTVGDHYWLFDSDRREG